MAKRKRLTPAKPGFLSAEALTSEPRTSAASHAPIASVAGEASASAALEEVSNAMQQARAEGRLIQRLPLDSIVTDYLVRDRLIVDQDDLTALVDSLRRRGQQTPIEVSALGQGRYGLISGARRMMALQQLQAQTGEDQFADVLALIREPADASEAYVAMIEENEIRVGLSHYERARIALRATEAGIYPDVGKALLDLFASASRAKRSKIRSFITIVQALDGALRFPTAIGERLGLMLAAALDAKPTLGAKLHQALSTEPCTTADAEQDMLRRKLTADKPTATKTTSAKANEIIPGVRMQSSGEGGKVKITLSGPAVDEVLQKKITDWLKSGM